MYRHVKQKASKLFYKIAEPRAIRIMQFCIYGCMMFAGVGIYIFPPSKFELILGEDLLLIFNCFIFIGGLFGIVAVLPGIWWLERVGLISLTTGMVMYSMVTISLGASPIGVVTSIAFALTFAQRWLEIRKFQLAPREE